MGEMRLSKWIDTFQKEIKVDKQLHHVNKA